MLRCNIFLNKKLKLFQLVNDLNPLRDIEIFKIFASQDVGIPASPEGCV